VARVYSARLGAYHGLGGGSVALAAPTTGYLWVVRHMTAFKATAGSVALQGFTVLLNGTEPLWSLSGPQILVGTTYDWAGRHVLVPADGWSFDSGDAADWSLVIGGYQLATP
jgi:hypothetical protein